MATTDAYEKPATSLQQSWPAESVPGSTELLASITAEASIGIYQRPNHIPAASVTFVDKPVTWTREMIHLKLLGNEEECLQVSCNWPCRHHEYHRVEFVDGISVLRHFDHNSHTLRVLAEAGCAYCALLYHHCKLELTRLNNHEGQSPDKIPAHWTCSSDW